MTDVKLLLLHSNTWNPLTVCKQMSPGLFKMLSKNYSFTNKIFNIYVYIIIMSRRLCGYPWSSLAISPYHSSPPAGLQGYIPCPHTAAVCRFVLVVPLLHIHVWGSTGVHRLWARPCFWILHEITYKGWYAIKLNWENESKVSGNPKKKSLCYSVYQPLSDQSLTHFLLK